MLMGSCCAKFETGQTFNPQLPPKRSTTMLDLFGSSSNIVGATHARFTWSPCSLQSLKGCILPTMHSRSQHCWPNNVGSCRTFLAQQCWELLHPCWQWWAPSLKSCVKKEIMFLPLLAMCSRCDP